MLFLMLGCRALGPAGLDSQVLGEGKIYNRGGGLPWVLAPLLALLADLSGLLMELLEFPQLRDIGSLLQSLLPW